ncbi:MAG: hypothetical protein HY543_07665 [Deltaproteobacteria bacterium]|nr:hypothetical protein [Deltaproteobacteria bacterium]
MAFTRGWKWAMLCGITLCCTACFEVEETVRIGADGITTLAMQVRLGMAGEKKPTGGEVAGKKLGALGGNMTGVRLKGVTAEQKNGQMLVSIEAEADHVTDLDGFYRKAGEGDGSEPNGSVQVGNIFAKGSFYRVKRMGGKIRVSRLLLPGKKIGKRKDKASKAADEMATAMLGGIFMRFHLGVPGKVLAHNAETLDGQTLTWVYPMMYLSKQKIELWAEIEATPETERALLK